MRLSFKGERVLAVVAHPDDAELFCAGTLARARSDGAAIGICVLCKGEKGQGSDVIRNLAGRRRKEMEASARLLEAKLFMAGVPDGTLTDDVRTRRVLVEIFRRFKPSLVLAHAAEDYYPDHRSASALAEAASWFSASGGHKTKSPALATPAALWWMDTMDMSGFNPGFYVDISAHLAIKAQMLACHRSQLVRRKDPDFSPLAELMQLQRCARGLQAGVDAAEAFSGARRFQAGKGVVKNVR